MADWKMRQPDGDEQIVGSLETLLEWTSAGKIVKTDYVWNPILQKWSHAMDVIELRGIVGSVRGVSSTRHGCGISAFLVLVGLVGMAFSPMLGAFVAVVGLIMAIVVIISMISQRSSKE
jgi:hypothetical protein